MNWGTLNRLKVSNCTWPDVAKNLHYHGFRVEIWVEKKNSNPGNNFNNNLKFLNFSVFNIIVEQSDGSTAETFNNFNTSSFIKPRLEEDFHKTVKLII